MSDANLTAIMEREQIKRVERSAGRWTVLLMDGRLGIGASVGEALDKAKQPDCLNVNRDYGLRLAA